MVSIKHICTDVILVLFFKILFPRLAHHRGLKRPSGKNQNKT